MNKPRFKMEMVAGNMMLGCYRCGFLGYAARRDLTSCSYYRCPNCGGAIYVAQIIKDCGQVQYGPDRHQFVNAYYN